MIFDLSTLVEEIKAASRGPNPVGSVNLILKRVLEDPARIFNGMPEFDNDETNLFENDAISIWNCRFIPDKPIPPHDHQMNALIGLYAGTERNHFFKVDTDDRLSPTGHTDMSPGDILKITPTAIHAVECVSDAPSCGIHVYFGPLQKVDRSLFDMKTQTRLKFTEEAFMRLMG